MSGRCVGPRAARRYLTIAAIPSHDGIPLPITRATARREDRRLALAESRRNGSLVGAIVFAVAFLGLGGLLMLWQWLTPEGRFTLWFEYLGLFAIGAAGALLVVVTFIAYVMVRARRWLARIPTLDVMFVKTPDAYRE